MGAELARDSQASLKAIIRFRMWVAGWILTSRERDHLRFIVRRKKAPKIAPKCLIYLINYWWVVQGSNL